MVHFCLVKKNLLLLLVFTALFSCAKQGTITGGVRDTRPPMLDTLRSTPNYATFFADRYVRLYFDEWVVLKEVAKEVVISPPLTPMPKITLDKKAVVVDFDGITLRPNTTYTIHFGTAVRDLHEGNPAQDLRYVFSTGSIIDSLEVEGTVTDALTGNPVEFVSVMLNDVLEDSIILREKPYYFGKTDKSGKFSIKNVREGVFRCVAIEEGQTPNLKWNIGAERIGFADSLLVLNDTIKRAAATIQVFTNQGMLRVLDRSATTYGVVRLLWSDLAPSLEVRPVVDTLGLKWMSERRRDTVWVWYDFPPDRAAVPWSLVTGPGDTTRLRALSRADFMVRHRLGHMDQAVLGGRSRSVGGAPVAKPSTSLPARLSTIPFSESIRWAYHVPIISVDTSRWRVMLNDTVVFRDFVVRRDSITPRGLEVRGNWASGSRIMWQLLPGALTDYYESVNLDTLQYVTQIVGEKELGVLSLAVEGLSSGRSYVLVLLNGNMRKEERVFTAIESKQAFVFKDLLPAAYTVQLIEDWNANGRWDTGSYFEKRQPEPIFTKKLDAIKPNWQLEATISTKKEENKKRGN